jgi:cytochrome c2
MARTQAKRVHVYAASSDALRNSGITWTEDLLAKWLENSEALVKDNDMEFRVSNAEERAALVALVEIPHGLNAASSSVSPLDFV